MQPNVFLIPLILLVLQEFVGVVLLVSDSSLGGFDIEMRSLTHIAVEEYYVRVNDTTRITPGQDYTLQVR